MNIKIFIILLLQHFLIAYLLYLLSLLLLFNLN